MNDQHENPGFGQDMAPVNDTLTAPDLHVEIDDTIAEYIALDKRYVSEIRPFLEALSNARQAVSDKHGVGAHWQDEEGTVYKVTVPEWKSVKIEHTAISRTRREGEAKGELSMTAARELGYVVEGK